MARSVWKGPFIAKSLFKKIEEARAAGKNTVIKTWSRRSTILPNMVGLTFGVHNGNKFIPVLITDQMIGHKLGEFAPTRFFKAHSAAGKTTEAAAPSAPAAPPKAA
jgi:small subunit ribosomal protein S19